MSDKNRVITNGLFRKKMAELLGEDIVNTPQFNDFQALDVSTFTREVDKLIDNPPWSGGGSGGESDVEVIIFEGTEDQGVVTITCEKTPAQVEEITKPISAYLTIDGSVLMPLERVTTTEFVINMIMGDMNIIGQVTVYVDNGDWACGQSTIPLGMDHPNYIIDVSVSLNTSGSGDKWTVGSVTKTDGELTSGTSVTGEYLAAATNYSAVSVGSLKGAVYLRTHIYFENDGTPIIDTYIYLILVAIDRINKIWHFTGTFTDPSGQASGPDFFDLGLAEGAEATDPVTGSVAETFLAVDTNA